MQKQLFIRIFITMFCAISLFACKEDKAGGDINEMRVNNSVVVTKTEKRSEIVIADTLKLVFVTDSLRTLEDYKDNISKIRKVLDVGDSPTDLAIESLIPNNENEFRVFYQLTYSIKKDDWAFFDKMNSLIVQKAKTDTGKCIVKYSNMAEFVDGEYAEGFFDYIADIAYEKPDTFCKAYNYLLPVSREKLSTVYKKVCLGIEVEDK